MAIGAGAAHNCAADCHGQVQKRDVSVTEEKCYQCTKCEKVFGHRHLLQLHLQVHYYGEQNSANQLKQEPDACALQESNTAPLGRTVQEPSVNPSSPRITTQQSGISFSAKRSTGLTKIRLEDCLRCDACSCIYIDKNDYNKHMRNFHQKASSKKQKTKKGCKSCCRHCNCKGNHRHHSIEKERGNNNLFHYNIKDRWSKMVSQRINTDDGQTRIKQEPHYESENLDLSHLLSQVEVKIKTEPPDEEDCNPHLQIS